MCPRPCHVQVKCKKQAFARCGKKEKHRSLIDKLEYSKEPSYVFFFFFPLRFFFIFFFFQLGNWYPFGSAASPLNILEGRDILFLWVSEPATKSPNSTKPSSSSAANSFCLIISHRDFPLFSDFSFSDSSVFGGVGIFSPSVGGNFRCLVSLSMASLLSFLVKLLFRPPNSM